MLNVKRNLSQRVKHEIKGACGTSYHASLVGKYIIERFVGIPVRVEFASEFKYHSSPLTRTLVVGITQSGETADTLEALRGAKRFGARTMAITNVLGSSVKDRR